MRAAAFRTGRSLAEAIALADTETRRTGDSHMVYKCDDDRLFYAVREGGELPGTGGTLIGHWQPHKWRDAL